MTLAAAFIALVVSASAQPAIPVPGYDLSEDVSKEWVQYIECLGAISWSTIKDQRLPREAVERATLATCAETRTALKRLMIIELMKTFGAIRYDEITQKAEASLVTIDDRMRKLIRGEKVED